MQTKTLRSFGLVLALGGLTGLLPSARPPSESCGRSRPGGQFQLVWRVPDQVFRWPVQVCLQHGHRVRPRRKRRQGEGEGGAYRPGQ